MLKIKLLLWDRPKNGKGNTKFKNQNSGSAWIRNDKLIWNNRF